MKIPLPHSKTPARLAPSPAAHLPGAGFLLGWYALIWGLVALHPGAMFATSPLYRYYAGYAPEAVWGTGFALAGLVQIARIGRVATLEWIAALALSAGFAFSAYLFIQASTASPAGYLSLLFAVWQILYTRHIGGGSHADAAD